MHRGVSYTLLPDLISFGVWYLVYGFWHNLISTALQGAYEIHVAAAIPKGHDQI